ncbi:amidase [Alicyclobacillus sp. ALC3]|uniref:amidase n=1 Tax=Alicyclobacillus sp. ALC3 TaxID=2796143 RepID=UPI0023780070|nr:amidase [Alicyclobacillus sp. ALC3]WDL98425.1 amidase [Alicyclobacillus sp. ALC3]
MSGTAVDRFGGNPQLFSTIAELTADYRSGVVSPLEVVEAALCQLEGWEPQLNAFITVFADEALAQARCAEQLYTDHRNGRGSGQAPGMLTGVPIGLKDLVDTAGKRTTSGSLIRKDFVPDKDAEVWTNLRDAGAILLGKTNLLEFAYGVPHPAYGQTNNPYDTTRTSGGSSGGSAAATSVGIIFGAVGSDTGGSIRIPASYCGVVGLKPTWGWVSEAGVFPLSPSLDHVGPLTRTPQDAAVMMDAMLGVNRPGSKRSSSLGGSPVGDSSFVGAMQVPSGFQRAAVLPESLLRYTHPGVKRAYLAATSSLEALGVQVTELTATDLALLESAEPTLMTILLAEAANLHQAWQNRKNDYAPLTWSQLEAGRRVLAVDYLDALERQRRFASELSAWFERFDLIALPTVDFVAPQEDPSIGDETMDEMRFTGAFNLSGHPAVSVPSGEGDDGLPAGIEFVGARFSDAKLLRFVSEFTALGPG